MQPFLHSDWASLLNPGNHCWLFWMCSTKSSTSVTSFYSIKKLSIWSHAVSKFTNFGCLVCQPDLRVFACMEFGRTITLVADHITTSQSGCLLNKCGNNQSVSSWHAVWAAWNRSQRSVPSLIFFSQHSLGPCLGLAVVWQQLHWKWLKLFLKWRNCSWRCWAVGTAGQVIKCKAMQF